MVRAAALTASAFLLCGAAPDTDAAWNCHFQSRQWCEAEACELVPATVWIMLQPESGDYWRCDEPDFAQCDRYTASVTVSGEYRLFELAGRSAFAKVGPGLSVLEVVSLGDAALVSHGTCQMGPPPLYREPRRPER